MNELREQHLGIPRPYPGQAKVSERLEEAYQQAISVSA